MIYYITSQMLKEQLHSLPSKQPGLFSTLFYIELMEWNTLHAILALGVWQTFSLVLLLGTRTRLQGHYVCHNAPVEYKRCCTCYFPPEWNLLR